MTSTANATTSSMDQLALSVAEACRVSSIGRTTLYQLIANGRLKTRKIGTRTLVLTSSLRALIEGGN